MILVSGSASSRLELIFRKCHITTEIFFLPNLTFPFVSQGDTDVFAIISFLIKSKISTFIFIRSSNFQRNSSQNDSRQTNNIHLHTSNQSSKNFITERQTGGPTSKNYFSGHKGQ